MCSFTAFSGVIFFFEVRREIPERVIQKNDLPRVRVAMQEDKRDKRKCDVQREDYRGKVCGRY